MVTEIPLSAHHFRFCYLFIFCTIKQVHLTYLDSILVYKLSKTAINKFI